MKVLKFGGSSVANADNISKVISIVGASASTEQTVIVVSALGGITDSLLQCASLAAAGDEKFNDLIKQIEQRHLETVKKLIPVSHQSGVLSLVMKQCNEIE